MVDLTVVIITKNEEKNIEKCIKSFNNIAKRFVIVDSYSTDNTKAVCDELRHKGIEIDFYENEFVTHANQLNWGFKKTNITTEWIMRIDADEELTEGLSDEINEKMSNIDKGINGIILKRRLYFMGRWIKHGGKYPELLLRIFRNGYGECEQKIMDEHLILKQGKTIAFNNDIIDNNTKSLEWWINKHNWYSDREMMDYKQNVNNENIRSNLMESDNVNKGQAKRKRIIKNKGYYKLPLFLRAHLYFIYRYYIRLGFLDGKEGKIYHFLQAYWYRFLVDSKIYESNITTKEGKS